MLISSRYQFARQVTSSASDRARAGWRGRGSAAGKLIALLPALPVLSAPTARAAIGVSQQQTHTALKALAEAGVMRQLSAGTYDRQYAATELFDLLPAYEEGITSPARRGRPARWGSPGHFPVPSRGAASILRP
jgi:hypothetical protein